MAFCLKSLTLRAGLTVVQRSQIPALNAIFRDISFTHAPKRIRRKRIVRLREEVVVSDVKPITLYQKELEQEVLTARDHDLPDEAIQNPYEKDTVQCVLCRHNITPDYKNVKLLSQFVSPHTGRVYGRHITGLCKAQQERVEKEIEKSQGAGLMATYIKQLEFLDDPKLFNPMRPLRPHPY